MFFSFIVPLIYFILANGLVVVISKRTFGKCMPITMMITAFTYFFSQVLCHTFKVGLIINVLYAIIFLIILIILKSKHKNQVLYIFLISTELSVIGMNIHIGVK